MNPGVMAVPVWSLSLRLPPKSFQEITDAFYHRSRNPFSSDGEYLSLELLPPRVILHLPLSKRLANGIQVP